MKFFWLVFLISASFGNDRVSGLILGSMLGDALGGPHEFSKPVKFNGNLVSYPGKATAFGAWKDFAPAGTITDDSRHKLIFIDFLLSNKQWTEKSLAKSYVEEFKKNDEYNSLRQEWLKEYMSVAQYLATGVRRKPRGALWSGLATVSGQLALIPLAIPYSGLPEQAYLKCWELNWLDSGTATDINCAIVAGLAYLLGENATLDGFFETLRKTDPYKMRETPFIGRPLEHWLVKSQQIGKSSRNLFNLRNKIREMVPAYYWWEDYAVIAVTFSYLEYFKNSPEDLFYYLIHFGKDTDTYAQLAGAILGAWKGESFFDSGQMNLLISRLQQDYKIDMRKKLKDLKKLERKPIRLLDRSLR